MITKKQWKCQQLAEHLYTISLGISKDTARQQATYNLTFTNEHGVIAEETRKLYKFVSMTLEQNIYGGLSDEDFNKMIKDAACMSSFLALNTAIVCSKLGLLKPLAVYADEIRVISLELAELCGHQMPADYLDIPTVDPVSKAVNERVYLFSGISGKYVWTESTQYIVEILLYCPEFIKDNHLQIVNGHKNMKKPLPVIDLDKTKEHTSENSCIVIINDHDDYGKSYAVIADYPNLNAIFNAFVGVSVDSPLDIPVRECWSGAGGSYINFIDWKKLC